MQGASSSYMDTSRSWAYVDLKLYATRSASASLYPGGRVAVCIVCDPVASYMQVPVPITLRLGVSGFV